MELSISDRCSCLEHCDIEIVFHIESIQYLFPDNRYDATMLCCVSGNSQGNAEYFESQGMNEVKNVCNMNVKHTTGTSNPGPRGRN